MLVVEFVEDGLVRLAQDVGQHIEPPAVRHADHGMPCTAHGTFLDERIEHRHEGIRTLDRKPLGVRIGSPDKPFQVINLGQSMEEGFLLLGRQGPRQFLRRQQLPEPLPLLLLGQVRDLNAQRRGIAESEPPHDVGRGGHVRKPEGTAGDQVEVGLRDAVKLGREFGRAERRTAEWIELHGKVPVRSRRLH